MPIESFRIGKKEVNFNEVLGLLILAPPNGLGYKLYVLLHSASSQPRVLFSMLCGAFGISVDIDFMLSGI